MTSPIMEFRPSLETFIQLLDDASGVTDLTLGNVESSLLCKLVGNNIRLEAQHNGKTHPFMASFSRRNVGVSKWPSNHNGVVVIARNILQLWKDELVGIKVEFVEES